MPSNTPNLTFFSYKFFYINTFPQPVVRRPQYISRPQYYAQQEEEQTYQRPQLIPSSTPASVIYRQSVEPVSITPRPLSVSPTPSARTQLPATTYRPQLLQVRN